MVLAVTSHPEVERKSRIATGKLPELGSSNDPVCAGSTFPFSLSPKHRGRGRAIPEGAQVDP